MRGLVRALPYWGPLVTLALVLALWVLAIEVGHVPPSLLPSPGETVGSLLGKVASGEIWPHVAATLSSAALGYVIGAAIALILASVMATSRIAERLLMLHVMAFQSIPKMALAPLIFLWCGFGGTSSVVLVTLSCIYPVFVNAFAGLRAADQNLVDLYRACGAGRLRIYLSVQLPSALGQIMVGLEISVVFALIAAVVMEFIAATDGLGALIESASATFDTATVFASVVLLAVIGMTASAGVRMLRRRIIFWEGAGRRELGAELGAS